MFEAFQEHDYRRFWIAQFVSNIGSWMQTVAQGWLVYRLTDSAFLLGFVGFANAAPSMVLMLPGGVLADQLDRKKVLRASQVVQALAALGIALAIHLKVVNVWWIIAAAAIAGTAISFSTPAYQAMIVDLLDDRSRLPNAVAMNSLQFNLSRVIGPLLAGATLSAYGSFWCFLLNALSFLPLIWLLGRLRSRQQTSTGAMAIWQRLVEGFRYVQRQRLVMLLLAVASALSLFGYPYISLMPVVARSLFTDDAKGLGFLMAGMGAGALTGALSLSVRTPRKRWMLPIILGSTTLFGLAVSGLGLSRTVVMAVAMLFLAGMSMILAAALCNTAIQQRVADEMRGRVMSMYTFTFYGFIPFGNLVAGALAEQRGIGAALLWLGIAMVGCAAVAAAIVTRWRR